MVKRMFCDFHYGTDFGKTCHRHQGPERAAHWRELHPCLLPCSLLRRPSEDTHASLGGPRPSGPIHRALAWPPRPSGPRALGSHTCRRTVASAHPEAAPDAEWAAMPRISAGLVVTVVSATGPCEGLLPIQPLHVLSHQRQAASLPVEQVRVQGADAMLQSRPPAEVRAQTAKQAARRRTRVSAAPHGGSPALSPPAGRMAPHRRRPAALGPVRTHAWRQTESLSERPRALPRRQRTPNSPHRSTARGFTSRPALRGSATSGSQPHWPALAHPCGIC